MTHEPMTSYYICIDNLIMNPFLDVENLNIIKYFPHWELDMENYFNKYEPCIVTIESSNQSEIREHVINLVKLIIHYDENDKIDRQEYSIIKQKRLVDGNSIVFHDVESWIEDGINKNLCGFSKAWNGNQYVPIHLYEGKRLCHEASAGSLTSTSI